jgi:hypothetical protein
MQPHHRFLFISYLSTICLFWKNAERIRLLFALGVVAHLGVLRLETVTAGMRMGVVCDPLRYRWGCDIMRDREYALPTDNEDRLRGCGLCGAGSLVIGFCCYFNVSGN